VLIQSIYELGIEQVFLGEVEPETPSVGEPAMEGLSAIPSDVDELVEILTWA
jgi:hypothetical protein